MHFAHTKEIIGILSFMSTTNTLGNYIFSDPQDNMLSDEGQIEYNIKNVTWVVSYF